MVQLRAQALQEVTVVSALSRVTFFQEKIRLGPGKKVHTGSQLAFFIELVTQMPRNAFQTGRILC